MAYALYLDDIRTPWYDSAPDGSPWVICRNSIDASKYVIDHGMPTHVAFDHDLGLDEG